MPGHPKSDQSYPWLVGFRNKRGIEMDLGKPEAQATLKRLVEHSDVFITNFAASVRKKLGVASDALLAVNPRLIYASFTACGDHGAEAKKPGFDVTAYGARPGLTDTMRASSEPVPVRPANGMGDYRSGITLLTAIAIALCQRAQTGTGGEVSSSLISNSREADSYVAQGAPCGAKFLNRAPRR